PELGPSFIERLYGQTDIVLGQDQRQMIDWVAQGRYAFGLGLSNSDVIAAVNQGLPVAMVRPEQLKEGASITSGGGVVMMADKAPHPDAAKLYVNWLLSRDGQMNYQKFLGKNSLRIDIPKDGL